MVAVLIKTTREPVEGLLTATLFHSTFRWSWKPFQVTKGVNRKLKISPDKQGFL